MPPETALVVIAAQLDIRNQLQQTWEMALLELTEHLPLSAIAKAEGGQLDTVDDVSVAWSPAGAYFLDLGPKLLAMTAPDDRQFVAKWSAAQKTQHAADFPEYLHNAVVELSAARPIVLALDLENAIQPHRLKLTLQQSEVLKEHQDQVARLLPIISGLKGIKLKVALNKEAQGSLEIDFHGDVTPLKNFAKPLILESLDRFDAHLPGLEKWSVHLEDHQIVMSGNLNDVALRRIFSLLEVPTSRFSQGSSSDENQPSSAEQAAKSSQQYYKSVATLIDDLKSTLGENRDNHAVWMERYAKKIDQLPLLGVDPALLDWGAMVAETMRTMALAERSSGIRSGVRKSAVYGDYFSYNNYDYNTGNYTSASYAQQVNQISTQEKAQAKAVRYSSWNDMQDATARVRREMTEKYQVEF
ncbi:hypothetical protein SH661x_003794 [Planctomicrobium sp. SH661]|uniref:hypothetical protein n=1 Tax=Planctomicrobium sp. SH661 TaxID=3448124 RepID=UPI003F5C0065